MLLVVNSGSSSLKMSLFANEERVLEAHVKNLNGPSPELALDVNGVTHTEAFPAAISIADAMKTVLSHTDEKEITTVGHRFVHGGPKYSSSVIIDDTVLADLQALSSLAPLHNPACIEGIKAAISHLGKGIPQVAVFDTAFHRTMPPHAQCYGINTELANDLAIQRYGFHGIAHAYLWDVYARRIPSLSNQSRVVTIHLGNGCSMAAIRGGKSLETSMGFTPAEGLLMGTRAGDIDVGAVEYLCRKDGKTIQEVLEFLNNQSGLLGVSGVSSDMRELLAIGNTNPRVELALDLFCYRVLKCLGAYIAVLGGLEAIIFSGGIGENSPTIRQRILQSMSWYGISLDDAANSKAVGLEHGQVEPISTLDAAVHVLVVGVDENAFIAREIGKLLQPKNG